MAHLEWSQNHGHNDLDLNILAIAQAVDEHHDNCGGSGCLAVDRNWPVGALQANDIPAHVIPINDGPDNDTGNDVRSPPENIKHEFHMNAINILSPLAPHDGS